MDERRRIEHEPGPALLDDTLADKAVRFGCGGILAALIILGTVFSGFVEGVEDRTALAMCVAGVVAAGLLSVACGEPFIRALLKLIKWLA